MKNVKDQIVTENYTLVNGDCVPVVSSLPDNSIDLSVYSPPFATKDSNCLYTYSSSPFDFSNCENSDQFFKQYEYLVKEISRVTKSGRITAVHCTDIMNSSSGNMFDFPNEIIKLHEKYGFRYRNRITIWKEPLKVRMRTMVRSLMHKLIVEDSTECFTAMPDYVLIFKKIGENEIPVTHEFGLTHYAGATPILPNILNAYNNENKTHYTPETLWEHLKKKFAGWKDPKTNKLSHYIWQRYASSVWDDIRIDEVLKFKDSREDDDEKHVHPLQLDVIDRIVELYSNPNEVVLTPFMGVGSEVFSPVSMGRKGIGIELKESYFKQAKLNMQEVNSRFLGNNQMELF